MIAAFDARHLGYNNDGGGKYTPKRALNHNVNEVRRGIVRSSLASTQLCKEVLEIFRVAESEGKDSQFCKNVNTFVDRIIEKFQKDGRPVLYCDQNFIADFIWEWQRIWAIHKFVHDNHIAEYDPSIDINSMFPPYNSCKRYEMVEQQIRKEGENAEN